MAQRSRKYFIRYGGWRCGTSQSAAISEPAFMGEHSCYDETHPGPPYTMGGPLLVKKEKVFIKRFPYHSTFYHAILGWYDGYMGVRPYVPSPKPTPLNLSGWGAKGISRTLPLHPIYNLGVSLGELRDLPRMVTQTLHGFRALKSFPTNLFNGIGSVRDFLRKGRTLFQNAGDTYLYGAFGLWPMLQDLLFLLKMREKLDKKLAWIRRHNGKSVRRKVELNVDGFSEDLPRSISQAASCFPQHVTQLYTGGQNVAESQPILKTYQRRIWFSAKYRFHIPELVGDPRITPPPGGLVADLLGLSPDPAIIYKLMPWSWLIDWFSSVGAVLSNVYGLAKYHTVIQYAYVMCQETFSYTAPGHVRIHTGRWTGSQWSGPDVHHAGYSRTEYTFRQREEANPYGFGITYSSLSAYQWSILAALGLSRGSKHSAPRA